MSLKQKLSIKEEIEKQLIQYSLTYLTKYLKRMYEYIPRKASFRVFQEELLKIAGWSNSTREKEFQKYCKWINKKYGVSEEALEQMLNTCVTLTIELIIPKRNEFERVLSTFAFPTLESFYFKCIKKIARHLYENPKEIVLDNAEISNNLKTSLQHIIQEFVPLQMLVDKLNDTESECIIEYDFEKSNSSLSLGKQNDSIVVEKLSEGDKTLKYISSDEFQNEYYMSDEEQKQNIDAGEDSQVKHVTIPKKK